MSLAPPRRNQGSAPPRKPEPEPEPEADEDSLYGDGDDADEEVSVEVSGDEGDEGSIEVSGDDDEGSIDVSGDDDDEGSIDVPDDEAPQGSTAEAVKGISIADPMEVLSFTPSAVKDIAAEINKNYRPYSIGEFRVWRIQDVAGKTLVRLNGVTQYKAPTGAGKTLTGIVAALNSKTCIISVPSKAVFGTWVEALRKAGLYDTNPLTAKVLINSSMPKHTGYTQGVIEGTRKWTPRNRTIILCKRSGIAYTVKLLNKIQGWNDVTVIVDEAQAETSKTKQYIYPRVVTKQIKRLILMSGSDLDEKKIGLTKAGLKFNNSLKSTITGDLPQDVWNYIFPEGNLVDGKVINPVWIRQIRQLIRKHKKPIVVSTLEVFSAIVGDMPGRAAKTFEGKGIVRFTSAAITAESRVDKEENVLVFLNSATETGVNVHGDALIMTNPGPLLNTRLVQLIARPLRATNPNRVIQYYILCANTDDYLKSYYCWAFYHHKWPEAWGRDDAPNTGMIHKGMAMLKALGEDPEKIDRTDACVVMANYPMILNRVGGKHTYELYEPVLEWWNKYRPEKSILDADLIRDLIW